MKLSAPVFLASILTLFVVASACRKDKAEPTAITPAIAYYQQKNDSSSFLWYITTDGSSNTQVLPDNLSYGGGNPCWSADGRSIFYIKSSSEAGSNGIYSIKPNGSDLKKVYGDIAGQTRNYYQLASSGDDEHIVFSLDIPRSGRKVIELYRMCPCGQRVTRLTEFETSQTPLINTESYAGSFAPGDSLLVFSQSDPAITGKKDVRIYTININSKALNLLATVKAIDAAGCSPAFSPDGSQLLFSLDGQIHLLNSDGSQLKPLGNLKGYHPSWDRNGKDFYFSVFGIPGQVSGIYKSNINLTRVDKISKSLPGNIGGFAVN